jgi:hypothetical protein
VRRGGAMAGPSRTAGPETDRGLDAVPPANPAEAVRWWRAKDPTMSPTQIAARVGRSERTVRRVLGN